MLWFHAPHVIQETFVGATGVSAATGITVRDHLAAANTVDCIRLDPTGPFAGLPTEVSYGFARPVAPLYAGHDPAATVHGVFASDGSPALLSKQLPGHTAWFSAAGAMPTAIWRAIARAAGVHIYSEGTDPLYLASRLIGVHQQGEQAPVLRFPSQEPITLVELFDGEETHVATGMITLPSRPGTMRLYLLRRHGASDPLS